MSVFGTAFNRLATHRLRMQQVDFLYRARMSSFQFRAFRSSEGDINATTLETNIMGETLLSRDNAALLLLLAADELGIASSFLAKIPALAATQALDRGEQTAFSVALSDIMTRYGNAVNPATLKRWSIDALTDSKISKVRNKGHVRLSTVELILRSIALRLPDVAAELLVLMGIHLGLGNELKSLAAAPPNLAELKLKDPPSDCLYGSVQLATA